MNHKILNKKMLFCFMAFLIGYSFANATIAITFTDDGDDMVMAWSGSLDITGGSYPGYSQNNLASDRAGYLSDWGTVYSFNADVTMDNWFYTGGDSYVGSNLVGDPFRLYSNGSILIAYTDVSDWSSDITGSCTYEGVNTDILTDTSWILAYTAESGYSLTVSAVPEPAESVLAIMFIAGGFVAFQRSRKRAA